MSIILNSVTYNWAGFDPSSTSRWTATAGGLATSFANLTNRVTIGGVDSKNGVKTARMSKVKWRLNTPTIATADSDCACVGSVLRTYYIDVAADFDPTATSAERTDALARLRALVLTTEFENSFLNLAQAAG